MHSHYCHHCPNAWLLYIGGERGNTGLFVVASMERFSDYEVGGNGRAYVEWSGLGVDYRFDGTVSASQIDGKIQVVDRRSRVTTYFCSITAAGLPPQPARANPGPGLYHLIRTPSGALFGRDDVALEDRGRACR